ncbi:MAG: hypothetical protein IT200_11370 [Thermoleophilia bacterium]|nr:hypothetical protein [Thermoleophilia bacterium]
MSTSIVTDAGVGLAASPLPHAAGMAHPVREHHAYLHPQPRFDRSGWAGFHVTGDVLHVHDPAAMAWLPVGDLRDLPEGRWVRLTDHDGRLAAPFELRRHLGELEARWLGGDGALLPADTELSAEIAPHPGVYATPEVMERWLAFGSWQRLPVW